jgi:hypothetical protein
MSRSYTPLPASASMACRGTALLYFYYQRVETIHTKESDRKSKKQTKTLRRELKRKYKERSRLPCRNCITVVADVTALERCV